MITGGARFSPIRRDDSNVVNVEAVKASFDSR